MCFLKLMVALAPIVAVGAESPASKTWADLGAKREKLAGFHEEFEVTTTTTSRDSQATVRQLTIDVGPGAWRETMASGSGKRIRIFDGKDTLSMEEGGDEYIRTPRTAKGTFPLPPPYDLSNPDWSKATEKERRPCGLPGADHECILFDIPLKAQIRMASSSDTTTMSQGNARFVVDTETGLIVMERAVRLFENRRVSYTTDVSYSLKRIGYGKAPDAALFELPAGEMRAVKEFTPWNAAKIRKQLGGHTAPNLEVRDLQGKPVNLADFKGKTVLLDFWTTWCPPCRADAPALDKLYRKYGGKELMIVGISVSEDRKVVEKYLSEHGHDFPVVLTSENEMPRPYEIGLFPTYIVIEKDGTVASAVEGDQGFGELRKLLRKAGLEVD